VIFGYVANQAGYLGPKLQITTGPTTPTPTPTTPSTTVSGIVTSAVVAYDSLSITTPRTIPDNVAVTWYAYRSGAYVLLGSGTSASLSITPSDQNTIYAMVSVPSGQSFYVDYAKIKSMNTRVTNVQFKDITGDGVKELVFTVDLTGIPYASATGQYTMPSLVIYLLSYDSSASLTVNGAVSSIGTTQVTKYLQNYVALAAEKKALAISKVVVQANTSDISKVALSKQNIPGIGYVDGSSFAQDVQASQIQWTYTVSSTLFGADYIQLPPNTLNKFDFTTAVQFTMSSGMKILITLNIYYLDSTGASQVLSDTVLCSA